MKVALIVMPFAQPDRPSLAAGLLKSGLEANGIECDTKYFNLLFWRLMGPEPYQAISAGASAAGLAGDWVFSQVMYGNQISSWESYEREVLDDPIWGNPSTDYRPAIRHAVDNAPQFLRLALESNDWSKYDLVGFTSTFEQTMASLCLAKMIREQCPDVKIALGGANFEAGMGRPYIEHYPFVDFVATGESDKSFPALCRNLRDCKNGAAERLEVPPGILYRNGVSVVGAPVEMGEFVELDALPTPNFDDFFDVLHAHSNDLEPDGLVPVPWLQVEASRGCWWGEKSHCSFCGLNGSAMTFRRKDWRRVVQETDELRARYKNPPLQFSDNILDYQYFKDLLPHWAEQDTAPHAFFEVKTNMRRSQVRLLKDAGIRWVQGGVESFAETSLRLMGKGVSGAQNVAFLRWCAEVGISCTWYIIFGFPQEDVDDYHHNVEISRCLTHLEAPGTCTIIRMDRFSPNYMRWKEKGFESIAPMPAYRHIFPLEDSALNELAYYFSFEHSGVDAALEEGGALIDLQGEWMERYERGENGELAVKPHWQGGYVLIDSRYNFPESSRRLDELEMAALLAADAPVSMSRAAQRVAQVFDVQVAEVETVLARFLEESVIARLENQIITLALLPEDARVRSIDRSV